MTGVGPLISSLISSVTNLLPKVRSSFFTPSSSSSAQSPNPRAVEEDLYKLMRMLERIKAILYDAEDREIRDRSVKLWLKELKEVAHDAEHVIDEYMYEVYRAQVETRNASELNPRKRNKEEASGKAACDHFIRVPEKFVDSIRDIRSKFDEITKDRVALCLRPEDGPRRDEGVQFRALSSHLLWESNVFGRKRDKEKVINLLFPNINEGIVGVISIVGKGGLGKTTLAQLVFNDKRVKQNFHLFGWTCVSEDFIVERLLQDLIESFTGNGCSLKTASALHDKIKNIMEGKRVIIVLDDVWNEDKNFWESFYVPFKSALSVVFIVTTRSDRVAQVMETTSLYPLEYLSEEDSWSLFQHYAFSDNNVDPNMLNIGRQITKKCGGLPLAVKSISNLLRFEGEKSWTNILQNDLWGDNDDDKIFRVLQISYTHMPAYLRPCFLFCSLFPKNYNYYVDELIELWIAQGYIESEGKRNLEEIAFEYVIELRERSFLDPFGYEIESRKSPFLDPFCGDFMDSYSLKEAFTMHDIVHDLAKKSSEKEFYYIDRTKQTNLPDEVQHVYMYNSCETWNHLNQNNITRLRTLISKPNRGSNNIDLSEAKRLRALKMQENTFCLNSVFPKHLRFLELTGTIPGSITALSSLYHLERLKLNRFHNLIELEALRDLVNLQSLSLSFCKIVPESLGLLCSLRILCIKDCTTNGSLEIIGNLIQLEYLLIHGYKGFLSPESLCKLSLLKTLSLTECPEIVKLPNNVGNLTNLQNLLIWNTGITFVPPSFTKLNILSLKVQISLRLDGVSDTISWLEDFDDLKGSLSLRNLRSMHEDACKFNLRSKPYIEKLILSWTGDKWFFDEKDMLQIEIDTSEDYMKKTESTRDLFGCDMDLWVLENLQPHPNLKQMIISDYNSHSFPTWMGHPSCCASLQEILLGNCCQISYLPFLNLSSLTHLSIYECSAMKKISREFIPSQLQNLIISNCNELHTVMGLEGLESLVLVTIGMCARLASFPFELISEGRCHKSPSGLKNLSPVKKVFLDDCPELQLAVNEVIPSEYCDIEITKCEGLKDWCLQHNISYTNHTDFSEEYSSSDDLEEDTADGSEDGDDDNEEEDIVENSEDGNSDDSQEEDSEDGDLGDKEEEDILENIEDEKLDDNKGKQIMETNEVRSPTSQGRQIPTGQGILKHMEKGSSSTDVINKYTEKGNSASDED